MGKPSDSRLAAAVDQLRHLGATDVACWLPTGHEVEPHLRRAGFAIVGTQTLLLGSATSSEHPPEAIDIFRDRARPMHFTMSDVDHA